jgi:peptidoglycan/xylan/chitin deacetylase (PgdA/CDA1 family)
MSSNGAAPRRASALIGSGHVTITPRWLPERVALLSIDVETDYGTGRSEALSQAGRLLDLLGRLQLPLTAFVEGQLFERQPRLCRLLVERGVDVQLHVYDHATAGDTPASLARGVEAYNAFMGRGPDGYRAHTYRLTPALYDALVAHGFTWDSSVMRALGLGRNADPAFRTGDYFQMGDLVEFPLGAWRYARLPLNHPYSLLAGSVGGAALRSVCGPAGSLVACNVHMTDLVRSPALAEARYGRLFEWMQRWMWLGHGSDSFATFTTLCTYLRSHGFTFMRTSDLYAQIVTGSST